MSEVMALMMNERDFGEELTSFQSDEDEDDDDEDDEDIDLDDDEDDEDMYMLYEEEPPCYDVVARLKELNEALKNEIIPADYEERSRKVQFKENPIFMEIYTSTGFSDEEEDNEEDVDDDGYGDSTEVSDEVNEENGNAAQKAQPVVTTLHELSKLRDEEKKREEEARAKRAQEMLEESVKSNNSRASPDVDQVEKDDSLISEIEKKLALNDEKAIELVLPEITFDISDSILPESSVDDTESVLQEISAENSVLTNVENNEEGLTNDNNILLSSTETLDAAEISPVATLNVSSSDKCDVPVPETGSGESFLNKSKKSAAQNGHLKNVPESRNSARKMPSASSSKSIKVRPRSSSVPPKMSNGNSDSMIMASKGKFHVMTTDDIQSRKSLGSARETRKSTRTSAVRTPSKSATPRRQSAVHKNDSSVFKVNSGSETSSINGSLKSPPSLKDAAPTPKIMPKYAGEGPSKYGLTTAQKMEKKLNSKLVMDNFEGKKQVSAAEKARKREQMDEAYRIWLQRKKLHAKYKSAAAPLKDSKNSSQNSSQNEVNGETNDKRKSGPAFDDWILMKKLQKKKNLEIERMKKKVEMEISYVKTNEQNRKSFSSWSKQKKRNSPSLN